MFVEGKQNWLVYRGTWHLVFCYISRLSLQQQQKNIKNRSEPKQSTPPVGTYNNTNLILKTMEWMIYKYFPYIICIFFLRQSVLITTQI